MKAAPLLVLAFAIAVFAQQPPPAGSETTGAAKPKVKTGKIEENKLYKSSRGTFSITVPAAGNAFVRTYEWQAAQLKQDTYDYEEVVFYISDFGEAYGAGVRRIPQSVVAEMAKEEEKQTLSNLADKALFQWRDNYAEEPKSVDELSVQTQFGQGLLRIYLAPHSSLLSRSTGGGHVGDLKLEKFDAYIAVLVVKKDDRFIYATAEDDWLQTGFGAASDPKSALQKGLQNFFASMSVAGLSSTMQPPSRSEAAGDATPNSSKPSQQEAPAAFLFSSVAFATPQSGWAVGIYSVILHTEDGGGTWRPQTSGSKYHPESVAFVTSHSGWAVGQMGTILHTEDGGNTWKTQASGTNAALNSVAFVTPQSGWAVGQGGTILHTENGGSTWKQQRKRDWRWPRTRVRRLCYAAVGLGGGRQGHHPAHRRRRRQLETTEQRHQRNSPFRSFCHDRSWAGQWDGKASSCTPRTVATVGNRKAAAPAKFSIP